MKEQSIMFGINVCSTVARTTRICSPDDISQTIFLLLMEQVSRIDKAANVSQFVFFLFQAT